MIQFTEEGFGKASAELRTFLLKAAPYDELVRASVKLGEKGDYKLKALVDAELGARAALRSNNGGIGVWTREQGAAVRPSGDAERELPERFVIGGAAVEGYQDLADILTLAYRQSAEGKGKDRHGGTGKPFDRQPIMEIARMTGGIDFHVGQAIKKAQEASTMVQRDEHDRARAELLGVIVYAAAAFKRATELKAQAESGTT